MKNRIEAQSGIAFLLQKGERLVVRDVFGQQVSDLFCFSRENPKNGLSSGRSIDYEETIFFTQGNRLLAHSGQVMLTLLEDSCGRHDFLVTPCSCQMFQMISKKTEWHPSCQENLEKALSKFGIQPSQITTTFNIFMNVEVSERGRVQVLPPRSKPGDAVVFRAEIDLIVGLTACSDEGTNNGTCKPIEFEILPPDGK